VRKRAGEWGDRLRFHVLTGSACVGLALGPAAAGAAALASGLAVAAGALAARARLGVACGLLIAAAAAAGDLRLEAIDAPGQRLAPFARIDERALVLERPRVSGAGTRAALRLASGPGRGAKVLAVADGPWRGPSEVGRVVRVRGLLKPPLRGEGDRFDWPAHLRRHGIRHELHLDALADAGGRRGGVAGAVDSARRRAEAAIAAGLEPSDEALARGMVLGEDEAIDPLAKDDWRDAGLAHLLAVSGQNVMLLCALALPLLAAAGTTPRVRVAVLLALIALYVPLAGAAPSLQRAAVMGAAGLFALASSRPASAAYGLLLAGAATLAVNPRIAGDPGWQLSFAAVTGILLARPFAPRGALAGGAWLTVVATLATAPLLALHFEAVPLVSIPANLAALPAVAPVMWIGMAQAAVGQLAALGPPGAAAADAASRALALPLQPLLAWLELVAARAADVPHAVAPVHLPGAVAAAAAYALLLATGWAAARLAPRAAPHLDEARARVRVASMRTRAGLALAAAGLAVLAAGHLVAPSPPGRLTVSFLDVGQGDATLVQHPDGSAVLFDGGRPEARVARLLKQAGVRRLSIVVATHASADHHGGLAEVIRRFPVGVLLDGGDGTPDPSFRRLLADARARGIAVATARAGQQLRAGGLTVRVVWPPPRPPGPAPEDPNPRAVVALVSSGRFDLMLSADAESPTLAGLHLPDVEAIKVPHHGSSDPGLGAVLRALRPEVAVIEVGENSYGHPNPDTLRTLEAAVPEVRRTDRDGTVRLVVTEAGMSLE
jgi:competence protein ComEC